MQEFGGGILPDSTKATHKLHAEGKFPNRCLGLISWLFHPLRGLRTHAVLPFSFSSLGIKNPCLLDFYQVCLTGKALSSPVRRHAKGVVREQLHPKMQFLRNFRAGCSIGGDY
jgi:hypothetical protein